MTTFNDRKAALFQSLVMAESQIPHQMLPPLQNTVYRKNAQQMRKVTKPFKGRNSIYTKRDDPSTDRLFAKPSGVRRNPQKWTYYNMEDVPEVSERSNAEAAAACMKEIELTQRLSVTDEEMANEPDSKIKFRLPIKQSSYRADIEESKNKRENTIFINSKIILPEYVVGEKNKNSKVVKTKAKTIASKSNLKLDHLFEEENDDE